MIRQQSSDAATLHNWQAAARLLAVLSGGYRFQILLELAEAPQHVSTLAKAIDVSVSTISQNLRELRSGGLVVPARQGQKVLYKASPQCVLGNGSDAVCMTAVDAAGSVIAVAPAPMDGSEAPVIEMVRAVALWQYAAESQ